MPEAREEALRRTIMQQGASAFGAGWTPDRWAIAPGRLELLGNHVDYNGGLVLAAAVDRAVMVGISADPNGAGLTILAGDVSPEAVTVEPDRAAGWRSDSSESGPEDYALGLLAAFRERDIPVISGGQVVVAGDVPLGFGMSSSAALCVALALALSERDLDQAAIVAIAREAEHRAGSPVGAMDQSASVAGGVVLFDGADASLRRLEPDLGDRVFAVADSGVHHAIGSSAYPARVRESETALARIRERALPELDALGSLRPDTWAALRDRHPDLLDATLTGRVEHVVTEVARVREGVEAIEHGDWTRFGTLMTESGQSSAGAYEISHPRVEELVADLTAMPGVLGARMMGGGEGGPALALLESDAMPNVAAALDRGYFSRYPSSNRERFQVCAFGRGARSI